VERIGHTRQCVCWPALALLFSKVGLELQDKDFLAFLPEWQNTLLFSLSFHPKLGAIHILNRFAPFITAYLVYMFTVLPSIWPVILFSSSRELCGYCNVNSCSVVSPAFVNTKGNLTILSVIFSHRPNSIQSNKFDSIHPFYSVSEFDSEGQSQFNRSIRFSEPIAFSVATCCVLKYFYFSFLASFPSSLTFHNLSPSYQEKQPQPTMKIRSLAIALSAIQAAIAQTLFTDLIVTYADQGPGACIRMPLYTTGATSPVTDLTSNDMACGMLGFPSSM
jgi:hypothetical protein